VIGVELQGLIIKLDCLHKILFLSSLPSICVIDLGLFGVGLTDPFVVFFRVFIISSDTLFFRNTALFRVSFAAFFRSSSVGAHD
jgi:hypothetical protein